MKMAHITFTVENLEKSVNFYTEILGLELNMEIDDGNGNKIIFLGKDGETLLELIQGDKKSDNKDVSIGFYVDSIEDKLNSISEKIEINPTELIKPNPFLSFLFIEDPDGYRVQLLEEK